MTLYLKLLFTLLLLIPKICDAQKIKRKYRGSYEGIIKSYKINSGEDYLTVKETPIHILVEKKKLIITIGNIKIEGVPELKNINRNNIELILKRPNDFGTEKIRVFRKNKTIIRKGISPQPDAELLKQKKRD